MRSLAVLFSWTLAVAAVVAPLARAQEEPPDAGQDDLDKKFEDFQRKNEEFQRRAAATSRKLEATLADFGYLDPWPPPPPEPASAAAWRDELLAAPRIELSQVLAQLDELRLDSHWTVQVADVCPRLDLLVELVEAVHAAGKRTGPDGAAELNVTIELAQTDLDLQASGRTREDFYLLRVACGVVLPARVLRGEQLAHGRIEVGRVEEVAIAPGRLSREELVARLDRCVTKLLSGDVDPLASAPSGNAWAKWLAQPEFAEARWTQFRESQRIDDALDAQLASIDAFGAITGAYSFAHPTDETRALTSRSLAAPWIERLSAFGVVSNVSDAPVLRHDLRIEATDKLPNLELAMVCDSRVSLVESDALVWLRDGWARVGGATYRKHTMAFAAPGAVAHFVGEALDKSFQRGLDALGRGGPAPLGIHPDADAVDRYLVARQRVVVPEAERRAIANRIAHALAKAPGIPVDLRREWFVDANGARTCVLSYVGGARSGSRIPRTTQDAVRRMIDDLTREDPLGLFAFNDPFSHNGDPRVVLPDTFAEYFTRPRPSGPGALRGVQVLDAKEHARRVLMRLDRKESNPLYAELDALGDALAGCQVLYSEYIPPDGKMNLSYPRAFWFRAAPRGWEEASKALSPRHPLRRIGPPLPLPPDTLAEAERLLGESR